MITKSVLLACDADAAFRLFTERIDDWWPESRRHAGEPSVVALAPDGFLERPSGGGVVPLGRVLRWDPPDGLILEFFPGTDPDHPTEVSVTFHPEGDGTRVRVEHRPLPASADLWDGRAPRYAESWDLVVAALGSAIR